MITADSALYTSHSIESMSIITFLNGSDLRVPAGSETAGGAAWAGARLGRQRGEGRSRWHPGWTRPRPEQLAGPPPPHAGRSSHVVQRPVRVHDRELLERARRVRVDTGRAARHLAAQRPYRRLRQRSGRCAPQAEAGGPHC
eukprot:scaffold18852_cov95-Isochrysis_galbana.AAC.3